MPDASHFLSPAQFLSEIGGAISKATLWRRINDGSIRSVQMGGRNCRRLIPTSELDRLLTGAPRPQRSHLRRWHENQAGRAAS